MTQPLDTLGCIAWLEGEGYGSVYEYLVKSRYLDTRLSSSTHHRACILGLPERYGLSGDLLYYFSGKARVTVVDDRKDKIAAFNALVKKLLDRAIISTMPKVRWVRRMSDAQLKRTDLIISSEVLQRLDEQQQRQYIQLALRESRKAILFAPNPLNRMHSLWSGLSPIDLKALQRTTDNTFSLTYLDAPPFPPGLSVSRGDGSLNTILLRVLRHAASLERYYPGIIRRRLSHIVALES